MAFVDDEEVVVAKPLNIASTTASTTGTYGVNDLEIDEDGIVEFGDVDALSRAGLERLVPSDKNSYVRFALLTDFIPVRMAWMHFIMVGDKKKPYRCLSVRDKKHNITEMGDCCKKLNKDKDQGAQLVFAAIAVKYINADPQTGKYAKDPSTGEFPPVRWELGWLRMSQAGFKAVGELTQEEEKPHQFDVAMRNKESGIGYSSMEGVIEQNKDSYYLALRRTQQTIRKEEQNWEAWLVFFLKTMAKQKDNLAAKVKEEQALRSSLPALSRQILELAKTRSEITVKEIEDATSANRNTIKVHVKKLAEQNYLMQVGKGRGARYTIK